MNGTIISISLIVMMVGCAAAVDDTAGVELRPGEAVAGQLFDHGIGQPWVGGNPPSGSFDQKFSQYYSFGKGSASKKHIEPPKKHEIRDKTPTTVYVSYQMQAIPYSQYKTYPANAAGNTLWIMGATSWTQYAKVPQGSSLSLLATSPAGGNGYLYEITPDGVFEKNGFFFFTGDSQIDFYADTVGTHIMLFIIDGQVSNAIVIEVVPNMPPYQYPAPIIQPYSQGQIVPPFSSPISTTGDSAITIVSKGMRGYQVFLDGNYIGTEGTGGDPLDGTFSFRVAGNQNHEVRVYDGRFNYPKTMFFDRGGMKTIYVEPGMAA
jgi:hypothetical protein